MKKLRFAIAAVVMAAIFHFVPLFDGPEAWAVRGFLGAGAGLRSASLSVGHFFAGIGRVGSLEKENAGLKDEIMALQQKAASQAGLAAENASLKGLLAFRERTDLKLIPAEVVGADPDSTVRALVINCGSEQGVVRGDAVIVGDGTLVGKVESVAVGRSTVLLPTDPRSAIAVMGADHPEADGVASGEKGLVVDMTLIPQHAAIAAGDPIVTTGRENHVPRGLLLGWVESVTSVPSEPFMSATIVPSVDPSTLTKVAVIGDK